VSVSFGAPRDFVIRHGISKDEEYKVPLADGSLFLMAGAMQQKYLHGVPVGDRGLRFNLTFRICVPRGSPQPAPSALARGRGKCASGKGQSDERRIDPADNNPYTFGELLEKYAEQYREVEIHDYWRCECKRS